MQSQDAAPRATHPALPPFVKLIRAGSLMALHCDASDIEVCGAAPFSVPSFGLGDGYMLVVHLAPLQCAEVWRNGRHIGRIGGEVGSVQVFDLLQTWRATIMPPFNSVNIRLPQALLAELAEEAGVSLERLVLPMVGEPALDATMLALAQALLPSFHRTTEMTTFFAERVIAAMAAHLVDHYRGSRRSRSLPKEGLAHWQQRRVSDMILDNLETDIPVSELAAACGLSSAHFTKAFRAAFGLPPHRWMVQERVRRSTELMLESDRPLNEVAVASGFCDQSHFT